MAQNKYMAQNVYSPESKRARKSTSRTGGRNRSGNELESLRREFMRYKRETDIELEDLRKKAGKG